MSDNELLEAAFSEELCELMVISYIVLSNNVVTNRFIDRHFQMPVQAWSALYAIGRFPGIRAKEIRSLFPRPQNTISRAVSLLETRGLIVRQTSNSDGREKRLFTTEKGRELLAGLIDLSHRRQAELFAPLTADERDTFFRLARKIAAGPRLLQSAVMAE